MNNKALDLWSAWPADLLNDDYAKKRIKSAQSKKLTPLKVDRDDLYAYFQGSHGRYETFLDSCPCGDFKRSGRPCKHIFRLAIELGLMDIDAEHDDSAIPVPRNEMLQLDYTIDMVEQLSDEAQKKLLKIAGAVQTPSVFKKDEPGLKELLNSGLIIETEPEHYEYFWGKKGEIIELLDSEGILYPQKAKKDELVELCIKQIPEKATQRFGTYYVSVAVPSHFSRRKIHYYLHRKIDKEIIFDPESEEFVDKSLLETVLPDDDVTNQLIKRGYYTRE